MAGLMDIAEGKTAPKGGGYWTGFAQSTLSSPLELFGMTPAPEVESWRRGHPISGFGTELLGTSIPYLGWGKVSSKIAPFERLIQGIGDVEKAPILSRAAQEITRYAPFEAVRAGVATSQDHDFGKELFQSTTNLGMAGLGGGLLGALESAGTAIPRRSLADIAPTVEPDAPLQLRLRQLRTALNEGNVTDAAAAENRFTTWLTDARRELPGLGQRHVAALEGEAGADIARDVERNFFRPDDVPTAVASRKPIIVRQFTHSGKAGFRTEADWRAAASDSELPENFPLVGQYFRYITASTERATKRLDAVANKLTRVGDWRIGKEADGNYILLHRLPEDEFLPGHSRWMATKTDDPSVFSKELRTWKNLDTRWESWVPPEQQNFAGGGDILQSGLAKQKELPFSDYTELQKTGRLAKLESAAGPLASGARDLVTHYLTPTMNQFARQPLANWIWSGAKDLFTAADLKAGDVMLGKRDLVDPKEIAASIFGGTRPGEGGLKSILEKLTEPQVKAYYDLIAKRPTTEQLDDIYSKGLIDDTTYMAYNAVKAAATKVFESVNATKRALGERVPKSAEGHGGFSRKWEGSLRQGITDEGGHLIAIADADNAKALEKRAAFIIEKLGEEGHTGLKAGKAWDGQGTIPAELRSWQRNPNGVGVRGFKWDFGEHGTKGELIDELYRNIQTRYREEASLSLQGLYDNAQRQLKDTDPRTWSALDERLNALKGEVGPVTTMINRVVDPVLSPILGKGSAGKIVDSINKGFWHLQLGAFNLAHPVANLIGIFQTVLPELAYVMHGAPERLAGYYSTQLVKGQRSVGLMSVLDPIKLMAKGTKGLFQPEPELLKFYARGVNEGVIDPKFLEEFAGQNASRVGNLKSILQDKGKGLPKAIEALSSWAPATSERMARSMAFSTAYHAGKDILGLKGDALYLFAKKFVDRTMYNYTMADRSMVLTSPVGRLFGSMKNWITHYISNMMIYAGEAGRGNVAPLAWQMATTGLIGGIGAVPFLPQLAGGYAEAVHDKNLLDWIYGSTNQRAGDALYMGLPAALGLSFSSATANPLRDANMLFSFAIADRAKALGRAAGAAVDHWQATGEHPASSEIARGAFARAVAPKALYRYLQVYDNPGIQSLTTGYPVLDEVNPWNKVLYTAGFQPNDIERGYLEFDGLMKDKAERQSRMSRYGIALAQALQAGDTKAVDNVLGRAMVDGLDISSVMRSANSRMDKASKGMLERNFSQAQRNAYESLGE